MTPAASSRLLLISLSRLTVLETFEPIYTKNITSLTGSLMMMMVGGSGLSSMCTSLVFGVQPKPFCLLIEHAECTLQRTKEQCQVGSVVHVDDVIVPELNTKENSHMRHS